MKLDTKLKIPLRNVELVMNSNGDANVNLTSKGGVKRKRCVKLRPKDHKLNVVNSCNGLVCFSEPSQNDPVVVCNPITGEYINLPAPVQCDETSKDFVECGLGFSPETNQYKVIRMLYPGTPGFFREPIIGEGMDSMRVAEIHTLGTRSWKRIGSAPYSTYGSRLGFPTYMNGALHWLSIACEIHLDYIISLDFDKERFQSVPSPPIDFRAFRFIVMRNMSLGVLGGRLCICDSSEYGNIDVWVMKEYAVQESWSKEFCIYNITEGGWWLRGLYEPMSYLRNGAILLFNRFSKAVFYHDPKHYKFRYLKLRGIRSKYEAIPHIPSFISLKDAVMGDDMPVMNITSRCAEFKLPGETKALYLEEENMDYDCPSSEDEEKDWWRK